MDYLKVPELPTTKEKMLTSNFIANLINAVYTPTTGMLAQIEDQKRVIEELRGKVERLEANDCSDGCQVRKAVKSFCEQF